MLNSYLDEFNGRLAASKQTEVEAADGVIELTFDERARGLLCLEVIEAGEDEDVASVKLTAVQLRRLIAELQAKLGVLTAQE